MAWFNDETVAAEAVTAERLHSVLTDHFNFSVNPDDDGQKFYAWINGAPVRFDASPLPFAVYVNASMFEQKLSVDRYEQALDWVTEMNAKTHFVTGYVIKDDEGVTLSADVTIVVEKGLSDEQLQELSDHALTSLLMYVTAYCRDFGFDVPGLTDVATEAAE